MTAPFFINLRQATDLFVGTFVLRCLSLVPGLAVPVALPCAATVNEEELDATQGIDLLGVISLG